MLKDIDELLVIDLLEPDYEDDPSMMYEDNSSLDEDYLSMMRYVLSTPNIVIPRNVLALMRFEVIYKVLSHRES